MTGFKINKRGMDQMQREIQKELNKRPVRIPIEAEQPKRRDGHSPEAAPTTVHHYSGPVVHVSGDGSPQIAFSEGGDITQSQQQTTTFNIAPEYQELAEVITQLRAELNDLGLNKEDLDIAAAAADEVLTAVAKDEPDAPFIRRTVAAIKGVLASIMAGANQAITAESAERAQQFFDMLGSALPA